MKFTIRVAVLYQDRRTFLHSRNTWTECVEEVRAKDWDEANALARLQAENRVGMHSEHQPVDERGLTPITVVVIGGSMEEA